MMNAFASDLRYALRRLVKSPAFSIVAVLTVGLANSTLFSVVNAVLLRPLPYPQSEQLVRVFGSQPQLALASNAPANSLDWKEENEVSERIGTCIGRSFHLTGGDKPETVIGSRASADLFQLLGVPPVVGPSFTDEEDQDGAAKVVILSYEYRQSRFGGDPNTVRQTITLNEQPHPVVGMMPAGFGFPDTRTQVATPVASTPAERETRDTAKLDPMIALARGR